jgi:hypothetical protein
VLTLNKLVEDKALVENLKKKIADLIEAMKSGRADPEKANEMIKCVELIVKTIVIQLEYQNLGGELTGDLPSEEELHALNDLIGISREEIKTRNETR